MSARALSPREAEVLHWLGEGKTVSEIGVILGGLSVKTVSTYRTRLLDKLALENTGQLMRYAILESLERPVNPSLIWNGFLDEERRA